ncbi:MAG: hypothetical protein AAFX57_16185 [Bacteroidota bacterium]
MTYIDKLVSLSNELGLSIEEIVSITDLPLKELQVMIEKPIGSIELQKLLESIVSENLKNAFEDMKSLPKSERDLLMKIIRQINDNNKNKVS